MVTLAVTKDTLLIIYRAVDRCFRKKELFMQKPNLFKRTIRLLLMILVAVWMFFEDWIWDRILAFMMLAARLKVVNRCEAFLARQNKYLLLNMFCVPFLIMIPAKLYGLFLISNGKIIRGAAVFIIAKVLVTAIVTRLFILSKDKLLQIKIFATFYNWFTEKKNWLYTEVRKLPAWQKAREWIEKVKRKVHIIKKKNG
jgi:hypothetical protein